MTTHKTRNRKDQEDRTLDYRIWRWNIDGPYYSADCDQIEWRIKDGEYVPAAVLELTRVDGYPPDPPPAYFNAILKRYEKDAQGYATVYVAERLGVQAFIVAFSRELDRFWVYNLSAKRGWWNLCQDEYARWIRNI